MLKMVDRTAEATPRRCGGTANMMELMFGDAKIPVPSPITIRMISTCSNGVVAFNRNARAA